MSFAILNTDDFDKNIDIDDTAGVITGIPDANNADYDDDISRPTALTTDQVNNINNQLDQLVNNTKVDVILPTGEILEGKDIFLPAKEVLIEPAPASVAREIIDTPVITPTLSGVPPYFLVQKRVLNVRHAEVKEKYYMATRPNPETRSHTEIAFRLANSLGIQTRYGNVRIATARKTYTKDEKKRLWDAKQKQQELDFNKVPELDESDEDYDQDLIEKKKMARNLEASFGRINRPTTARKTIRLTKADYQKVAVQNSVATPLEVKTEIVVQNYPKYQVLTLENGLTRQYGESEKEFEFRKYWTQIAIAIGEDISIGTAISLGKMKKQKMVWNVTFDPQMEELIKSVDEVYLSNLSK